MKRIAISLVVLSFAHLAMAVDLTPLAAAEALVGAINAARSANNPKALEALFAKDLSAAERAEILKSEEELCAEARRPLSEVTTPHLIIKAARVISPDVILVEASNVQFGSMAVGAPGGTAVLILKKEGADWRISALRNHPAFL